MDDVKFFAEKTSRRTFLKQSAAALAAATLLPTTSVFSKNKVKIKTNPALDSNFGGVQIGSTTYSWISQPAPSVHELINTCHKAGVSSLEIMYGEFAKYAGQPENVPAEQIVAWRKNMDLEKIKEIRNVLAAAGIGIHGFSIGVTAQCYRCGSALVLALHSAKTADWQGSNGVKRLPFTPL